MTTDELNQLRAKADAAIERIVREHALALEALTEKQIVELLRQVFASGDIIRRTVIGSQAQSVIYIPFAREQELSGKLDAIRALCATQPECAMTREIMELL